MNFTDKDFDFAASARIDRKQKKERCRVNTQIANSIVLKEVKKNKNCGPAITPYLFEDMPSNSNILEAKLPAKASTRKKREERGVYVPPKGMYQQKVLDSKSSNQVHDSPSNSKAVYNLGKKLERSKNDTKNSDNLDSHETLKVAELKDSLDNFKDSHSVFYNKDLKNEFYKKQLSSLTITFKNDDILVGDEPEVTSDFNSVITNEHSSDTSVFAQSSFSFSWNRTQEQDIRDEDYFIPPPKPVSPTACETIGTESNVHNHHLSNLNLNKEQVLHLEDNITENQSIHPNSLDLHVCEVTSTVPGEGNQVLEIKTTVSSDDIVCEVQSTVSSEDPVDPEQIEEISEFLKKLEFEKSMPRYIAEKILSDLKQKIGYYFRGDTVKLYGSYWFDAAVTLSNINFALVTDQPVKNNFLLCVQKTLSKEMDGYKVFPLEEQRNPRRSKICFMDNQNRIGCELIYLGVTVSNYVKLSDVIKAVCKYDSKIKTLIIVAKLWAEAILINEAENGKLHPIGFTLLVLHYLQQLEKPLLPLLDISSKNLGLNQLPDANEASIGELWLGFLKYYGNKFNWNEYVVTVTHKTPVPKSTKLWEISWLGIEDPVSGKNVADSVITLDTAEYITSCFKKSYQYFISTLCDSDSTSSSGSYNNGSPNIRRSNMFKLSDCISYPPPVFCSDDDSDYENCDVPQQMAIQEPLKFSKVSEVSLKCVDQVLKEAYEEYNLPDNQVKGREVFVEDLEKYIRKLYPDAKLRLFGSTVNGFGFKRSDLDICMTFRGKAKTSRNAGYILKKLVYHLRRKDELKHVFGLYSAKIPIVKFNFTTQNWHCDLSFYNVLAVHNSDLLYKYSMMDENCRILGYALKLLAKKTQIADCSTKTLSSYSYILMVIHFLQQVNPPVLPVMPVHDKEEFEKEMDEIELRRKGVLNNRNYWFFEDVDQLKKRYLGIERNKSTVGELWLEMLEYYLNFDYERAVSITEIDPVPSSSLLRYARFINIEDPFLSKRNLGSIVSEGKAAETRKILHRARMLFGSDYPCDKNNLKEHYFSPSNLTGRILKNIECTACGGFGHETNGCPKADPFKNQKPWNPSRKRAKNLNKINSRKP